jgi:hypothetical protein
MFEALKRALPLLALLIITTVTVAHAGVLGDIWNGVKDQAMGVIMGGVALGLNGLLGWLHNKNAARFNMVTKTMAETGEFLTTLGTAIQDAKVTREELGATDAGEVCDQPGRSGDAEGAESVKTDRDKT